MILLLRLTYALLLLIGLMLPIRNGTVGGVTNVPL